MKKKILCLILALSMLLSAAGMCVYAAEDEPVDTPTENMTEYVFYDNLYVKNGARLFSLNNYEQIYADVYNAIENKQEVFDTSSYNVPYSRIYELAEVVFDVVYENPKFFYVRSSFGYDSVDEGEEDKIIPEITLQYIDYTTPQDAENFFAKVDYIIASTIDERMSDVEKALTLHDYIAKTTTYYPLVEGVEPPDDIYTSYMVLMQGTGVCQGYALAYNLLLERVGIDAKYVASEIMNHAWSMVNIDEEWYHVDVTWDDGNNAQNVYHDYFLLSDTGMTLKNHEGWDTRVPKCTNTRYETGNYCFTGSQQSVKYENGRYYHINYVEVKESEIPPGETYYTSGGKYFIIRCSSSLFNNDDMVIISKDEYNNIGSENYKMYLPLAERDGVYKTTPLLSELAGSGLYIKTHDPTLEGYSIMICFYDENKRLISSTSPDYAKYPGFVKVSPTPVPSTAVSAKIMYWDKSVLAPVSNFIELQ